jgi:hypothetical protein
MISWYWLLIAVVVTGVMAFYLGSLIGGFRGF